MKKKAFVRFYYSDAHYYGILSHNTSVPMLGNLELATGTPYHMPKGHGL